MKTKIFFFGLFIAAIFAFGAAIHQPQSSELAMLTPLEMTAIAGGEQSYSNSMCTGVLGPSDCRDPEGGCWGLYYYQCLPNSGSYCTEYDGRQAICEGPYPECWDDFYGKDVCSTYY